jgi:nucleotide-binding universal stress UspA family protein|nr:UspA domain protein [Aeromicrobium sp.]
MTTPTIVVGVDGHPASHSALRAAIDEAALRGGRVMVVAVWSVGTRRFAYRPDGHQSDSFATARMIAHDAIAAVAADDHERSMIVTSASEGEPGHALVHASRDADLLVIGSTTRGAVARHAGKTTVDHCLRHSDIPVLVVPYAPTALEESDIDQELLSTSGERGVDISARYERGTR